MAVQWVVGERTSIPLRCEQSDMQDHFVTYIINSVETGIVKVSTQAMNVDFFTKPLGAEHLTAVLSKLQMIVTGN